MADKHQVEARKNSQGSMPIVDVLARAVMRAETVGVCMSDENL